MGNAFKCSRIIQTKEHLRPVLSRSSRSLSPPETVVSVGKGDLYPRGDKTRGTK